MKRGPYNVRADEDRFNATRLAYLAKLGNPTGRYVPPDRHVRRTGRVELPTRPFVPAVAMEVE